MTASESTTARRRGLTLIAIALGVSGLVWGGWHWLQGRHQQNTESNW